MSAKFPDQPLAIDAALKHKDPLIRLWAIAQGVDARELAHTIYTDDELAVRLEALAALDDQTLLPDLLLGDEDSYHCDVDPQYFSDNRVLTEFSRGHSTSDIIKRAVLGKLNEVTVLKDFVLKSTDEDLQEVALGKIDDDQCLLEIVDSHLEHEFIEQAWEQVSEAGKAGTFKKLKSVRARVLAVKSTTDVQQLLQILRGEYDDRVYETATRQIDDEGLLQAIAMDENFALATRIAAVGQVSNIAVLKNIAAKTDNNDVFKAALPRIDDQNFYVDQVRNGSTEQKQETAVRFLDQEGLVAVAVSKVERPIAQSAIEKIETRDGAARVLRSCDLAKEQIKRLVNLIDDASVLADLAGHAKARGPVRTQAKWRLENRVLLELLAEQEPERITSLLSRHWPVSAHSPVPPSPLSPEEPRFSRKFGFESRETYAYRVYEHLEAEGPLHLTLMSYVRDLSRFNTRRVPVTLGLGRPSDAADIFGAITTFPGEVPSKREMEEHRRQRAEREAESRRREAQRLEQEQIRGRAEIARKFTTLFAALLKAGADANYQDSVDATVLHLAMQMDLESIPRDVLINGFVTPLLDHGARTDILDRKGRSALGVAIELGWRLDSLDGSTLTEAQKRLKVESWRDSCWSNDEAKSVLRL